MNNIMEKLKNTRLLAGIGIALLFIGIVTPYIRYSFWGYTMSLSLWGYWEGKIIMLLAIANLLFIFKDIVEKYAPGLFKSAMGQKIQEMDNPKYSLIPTLLAAVLAIYLTFSLDVDLFKYYNIGFYSLWLGVICLVMYAILHRNSEN